MDPLYPGSSAVQHGGNGYRGPGAWKRPRKKHFDISEGPLDLGRILGNLNGYHQQKSLHQKQHGTKHRSKKGKTAALQARLESLSLTLAPSYGVGESGSPAMATSSEGPNHHRASAPVVSSSRLQGQISQHEVEPLLTPCDQPKAQQFHHRHQPTCCEDEDDAAARGGGVSDKSGNGKQAPLTSSVAIGTALTPKYGHTATCEDGPQQAIFSVPSSHTINQKGAHGVDALRIPNAATKMSVDDRCTSEILGARATLRALLKEQRKLGGAMRRRRLEACLGDGSNNSESGLRRRRGKPMGHTGRRRIHSNAQLRSRKRGGGDVRGGGGGPAKGQPHAHPLLFMTEVEIQNAELDQMALEDAEVTHLLK